MQSLIDSIKQELYDRLLNSIDQGFLVTGNPRLSILKPPYTPELKSVSLLMNGKIRGATMETKNMTTGQSGEVTPHPDYPGQDTLGRFLPANCLASKNAYYHDPAVLEAAVEGYFQTCEAKDQPPVVTGLALSLGFNGRQSLFDYLNRPGRSPFADIIKRAKSRIEAHRVTSMLTNKNNVIGCIFDLKCNHGYVEKHVIEADIKVAQSFTPEDREALKDLALQMIEAREVEDAPILIGESVSSSPEIPKDLEGGS